MRVAAVAFFSLYDAYAVWAKLRFLPEAYAEAFGTTSNSDEEENESERKHKHGVVGVVLIAVTVFFLALDVIRHYLVLLASEQDVTLIDFSVVNPVSMRRLQFTSHQLVDLSYFTSMILLLTILMTMAKTNLGKPALLLRAPGHALHRSPPIRTLVRLARVVFGGGKGGHEESVLDAPLQRA